MKKNRKKAETYRFNGHPTLHSGSIHPVTIADLESRVREFERKLADPLDPDDKKWTVRWLQRFQQELAKKRLGLERKAHERNLRPRLSRVTDHDS